jgi:hypothetical protein
MKLPMKRVRAIFAASSMLLALLCLTAAHAQDADESGSGEAKNSPPITQVAGTWTGTDTQDGSPGPMMLVLTQNQKKLGGTFSVTTDDETPAGSVSGKISKDDLKLTFHATSGTSHDCTAKVLATVDPDATPPTMEGTFLVKGGKHCKGKGTFELTQTVE